LLQPRAAPVCTRVPDPRLPTKVPLSVIVTPPLLCTLLILLLRIDAEGILK
jgi:hypothetical protein